MNSVGVDVSKGKSTVMEKFGVGPALGPQLMAEIGDVRRFKSKKSLVAFAGTDAPPCQSGTLNIHSRSIPERGYPANEPVCQFMN